MAKDAKASKQAQQPSGSQKQKVNDTRVALTNARQQGAGESRMTAWPKTNGTHN
jgi:hypothetical protein